MRILFMVAISGCLILSWGCSKKTADNPVSAEAPVSTSTVDTQKPPTNTGKVELPKDKAGGENPTDPKAEPATVAEAPAGNPAPNGPSGAVPPGDAPKVSEAECEKACAHASKLSLETLPPDATDEMKKVITEALQEGCPKNCMAKGTPAMVTCILAAKTGLDLAACPK